MSAARLSAPIANAAFPVVLDRGLRRSSQGLFSVPTPWAVRYFGRSLELECAAVRIVSNMADWIHSAADDRPLEDRVWHSHRFALGGGDWSELLLPIHKNSVLQEAQQLKAVGLRFREIQAYADYREAMERGRPRRRNHVLLNSSARIDAYFAGFIALFESIAALGFQRRSALHQAAATHSTGTMRRKPGWLQWFREWSAGDIGVAVDAQGALHRLPGGQHRMAVAHALDLLTVPVTVRLVHADWVRRQMESGRQSPVAAVSTGLDALRQATHSAHDDLSP
jgi:hypothetical protein